MFWKFVEIMEQNMIIYNCFDDEHEKHVMELVDFVADLICSEI